MPKTVLLADDSVVIQKLVGLSFANEDLRLITTDNGDDALVRAREEKPDLVLADVVMPGTNGYELCQAIKQDPELAHVPVLLLTGTFEAFDENRASQVGSVGHITKPFEAQGLVDRIQELLASSPPPTAATPVETPQAPVPEAEPTMVVQLDDDAYDFFEEEEEADLTPEPGREQDAADLGLGDADDGFAFGSNPPPTPELEPQPAAEVHDDLAASQPSEPGTPGPGSDRTVAIIPDSPNAVTPPPIPDDPMATRVTIDDDFAVAAAAGPARPPGPAAAAPPPPTATTAPSPAVNLDSFGSQNTAPIPSPPPIPASEPPPTQIIDGFSLDAPPPLPPSADPGETMLADDLFADLSATPETASPPPLLDAQEPMADEDLAFSFDAAPAAAAPSPAAPAPLDSPPATDSLARNPLSAEPVTGAPGMDPLAAPFDAQPLDASPPNDLLSNHLPGDDFAADAGESDDLLESFSADDASDFDVSSSDLGDPVVASFPPAPPAPTVSGVAEAESPAWPRLDAAPAEPEVGATPLQTTGETPPALPFQQTAAGPEAPPAPTLEEPTAEPDISPIMRDRIHEALEKVAWEAFADLSETIVKHVIKKVEEVTWEVVPQMVESLIQEEIRRMKGDPE